MKVLKITLIKRNRKYFDALVGDNKFKCKVIINSASDALKINFEYRCTVIDESKKTKYGTEYIYRIDDKKEPEVARNESIITFIHDRYNQHIYNRCKELSGKYDAESKCWVFSDFVSDEVEELDDLFNSDKVVVDLYFTKDVYELQTAYSFFGYTIVKALNRDSGAFLQSDAAIIAGEITSGGSQKNWRTIIKKDTLIRMEIPLGLMKVYEVPDGVEMEKYSKSKDQL